MQFFLHSFSFMTIPYSSIQDYLIDKLKPDFSPRNKDLTSAQLQTAAASSHPHKFQRSLPHPSPIPSISKIFLSVKTTTPSDPFSSANSSRLPSGERNLSCISFTASYFRDKQTYVLFVLFYHIFRPPSRGKSKTVPLIFSQLYRLFFITADLDRK